VLDVISTEINRRESASRTQEKRGYERGSGKHGDDGNEYPEEVGRTYTAAKREVTGKRKKWTNP